MKISYKIRLIAVKQANNLVSPVPDSGAERPDIVVFQHKYAPA